MPDFTHMKGTRLWYILAAADPEALATVNAITAETALDAGMPAPWVEIENLDDLDGGPINQTTFDHSVLADVQPRFETEDLPGEVTFNKPVEPAVTQTLYGFCIDGVDRQWAITYESGLIWHGYGRLMMASGKGLGAKKQSFREHVGESYKILFRAPLTMVPPAP